MTTINSISGGKTSAYIAKNYPADYNIFSLVRTNDKEVMFPDAKVRQIVSDRIGHEFIGTLEQDEIIYTILDLEQYIGQEVVWLSDKTFEEVIQDHNEYLPNKMSRFCTVDMKVKPIAQWCCAIPVGQCGRRYRVVARCRQEIRLLHLGTARCGRPETA